METGTLKQMSFHDKFTPYELKELYNGVRLPEFKPTKEQYLKVGVAESASNKEFLTQLCRNGFREKIFKKVDKSLHPTYVNRLKEELETIDRLGFVDYILMVWDICDFCQKSGIPIGPGRGSVSSSLLCFLVGITRVDSIKYGLFFTRFLNSSRAKVKIIDGEKYIDGSLAPDVDQDVDYYQRENLISYLSEKYKNKTAKLLATSSLTTKVLLKEVYKSYEEASESEAKELSDMVEKEQGNVEELRDALSDNPKKENKKLKEWAKHHPESIKIALKLANLKKASTCHASAILISHGNIADLMPLQLSKSEDEDNFSISNSCDMYTAQELSLKFDVLGLKTVSTVSDCCKAAGIKVEDIDWEDPIIYQWLQDANDMYGIFQFESEAQGRIALKIRPKNFKQITDTLSISRPGASVGMLPYLDYIHRGIYKPINPVIDDVMRETGGVCLFQEQFLKMLVNIGMSPDQAEIARRILGKKKKEEIPKVQAEIEEACAKNGHPKDVVDLLLKIAEDSGGYQFSACHATSYGMITAQTIWLKIKYPVEFYWACLKMTRYDSPKDRAINVARIKKEMSDRGIKLLPPSLIESKDDHSICDGAVRIGLSNIKGVAGKAIDKIHSFQAVVENKFSLFSGLVESSIPVNIVNALVMSGCLDDLGNGMTRNKFMAQYELYKILTPRERPIIHSLGEKYNYNLEAIIKACVEELKSTTGSPLIKESRRDTIRAKYKPSWEKFSRNSRFEGLTQWLAENEFIGFAYSDTLKGIYSKHINNLLDLKELKNAPDRRDPYICVVQIAEAEKRISKKNKKDYVRYLLKDDTESFAVMDFQADSRGEKAFKEGSICVFHVRKKKTETGDFLYFVSDIVEQEVPTVLKTSVVRKELEEKAEKNA